MSSLNQVTLIGNLGRDPEIRSLKNGEKVANLSVATSESWKDKNSGERKEATEWHRVTVFGSTVESYIEKFCSKGQKVLVQGQLRTRKWEKDGVERYTTEIIVSHPSGFKGLERAEGNDGASTNTASDETSPDELDDEIPF